jgi:TolA-binding protein
MSPRFVAIFYFLLAVCSQTRADLLDDARQAHVDGVPEVSITKAREFLATNPEPAKRESARLLLARCLIETRNGDQVDEVLKNLDGPEASFLKGQAALRTRQWKEAAEAFEKLTSDKEWAVDAKLGLAEAQRSLGNADKALATLEPLISAENPGSVKAILLASEIYLDQSDFAKAKELIGSVKIDSRTQKFEKLCLSGEIALREGDIESADKAFDEVLTAPDGRTSRVVRIAQLGHVKILLARQEYEDAEAEIERLISSEPRSPVLADLFQTLFQIYSHESNPNTVELVNWSIESPQTSGSDRPAYALFYLAQLRLSQGLTSQAQDGYRDLIRRFPGHPITTEAVLVLCRQMTDSGEPEKAVRILELQMDRAKNLPATDQFRISFLLGIAYHDQGNVAAARDLFVDLSVKFQLDRNETLFNAAICSLQAGDETKFNHLFKELEKRMLAPEMLGNLVFTRGLLEAKTGKASADETMRDFIRNYPGHPRTSQARLVEAEIRITEQPPDVAASEAILRQTSASADPVEQEQTDRLKFFVATLDASQSVATIAGLAQQYLIKYPESKFKGEIRMKLGEVYYHENDFPNAQTQFELVREESPDSPLVESALFLAGEAARKSLSPSSLSRANALFEEVYKLGGVLRFQARLEEALTMRQTRQENEAILLLDDLVRQNPPSDIRFEAIDNKGEAQFTLAADKPKMYEEAIATFDRLLNERELTVEWKQHALYQKGKCLEKLNRIDEALAAYYDVLAVEGGSGDQLWFFRAGFDAAQILENQHSWSSAAAIFDKLSNTRGARSEEAKNRLTRLKLEHFLWPE